MSDDADAGDLRVGVRTARDLTWKDGLDAFTCTECGRCKDACPTFLTGKPLSLKWVNDSLKHHLLAQREALLAPRRPPTPTTRCRRWSATVIAEDTLWACTTCGYCEAACPIELEHLPRFFRLRQHRVMMDGEFPHELKAVFDAYESQSNPWGLPSRTRAATGRATSTCRASTGRRAGRGPATVLFYVGSAQSFDPRGQKIARAFVAVLQAAGVRFAILGDGRDLDRRVRPPRRQRDAVPAAGAGARRRRSNELGVTRIVTCDPHAFNSLEERVPGLRRPLRGRPPHAADRAAAAPRDGSTLAPAFERVHLSRALLPRPPQRRVRGAARGPARGSSRDAPLEFPLNREKAMCCGAGGARMWMEETHRHAHQRAARRAGAAAVAAR